MVLVDTSVFIGYFRKARGIPFAKMKHLVDDALPFGICNHIYQELLQGALNKNEFETLKNYLGALPFFDLKLGKHSYENAAQLFFDCRKKRDCYKICVNRLCQGLTGLLRRFAPRNDGHCERSEAIQKITTPKKERLHKNCNSLEKKVSQ